MARQLKAGYAFCFRTSSSSTHSWESIKVVLTAEFSADDGGCADISFTNIPTSVFTSSCVRSDLHLDVSASQRIVIAMMHSTHVPVVRSGLKISLHTIFNTTLISGTPFFWAIILTSFGTLLIRANTRSAKSSLPAHVPIKATFAVISVNHSIILSGTFFVRNACIISHDFCT